MIENRQQRSADLKGVALGIFAGLMIAKAETAKPWELWAMVAAAGVCYAVAIAWED